jgi:hypothetical protein
MWSDGNDIKPHDWVFTWDTVNSFAWVVRIRNARVYTLRTYIHRKGKFHDRFPAFSLRIVTSQLVNSTTKNGFNKVPNPFYSKSQPFYQRYESNLPTSLTHINLIIQKLITLETCCGFGYGQKYTELSSRK